ncbi:MAG: L-aspartate oxidase [Bacillota bacterium]
MPKIKSGERRSDCLVIGTGIAGLYTAIKLAEHFKVNLVAKSELEETNTAHAQGGIAAAICPKDTYLYHLEDTLKAGAGLCNEEAVKILVKEGPARIEELVSWGAVFDRNPDGSLSLTREAAHSQRRILHAHGDATGAEISRALAAKARGNPNIAIFEYRRIVDLIVENGRCFGARSSGAEPLLFLAPVTVLATGGSGQLYSTTTNPEVATGDGFSMAYRAGCALADLEFIQFHPTALKIPGCPSYLISESVRGEGGFLINKEGRRFMRDYNPEAELAPRDIVARAITAEMEKTACTHVFLDLTHWEAEKIKKRFPTVYNICVSAGIDPAADPIPVAPAAHYMMGGVYTDTQGRTTVDGLFACGEVACTGVHGANRLASNSLLEGLVFGRRIAEEIFRRKSLPPVNIEYHPQAAPPAATQNARYADLKRNLQEKMTLYAGITRNSACLSALMRWCEEQLASLPPGRESIPECVEVYNMLQLSILIGKSALLREESRGAHFREDFPDRSSGWEKHIILRGKEISYEQIPVEGNHRTDLAGGYRHGRCHH